ncbi:hypothetical protein M427DRAFT_495294 [Gonapodya prolifera JEL478]|uniref:Uncharacterized protein n=1 Tax=Gonapodya prolifera (strain JEL478) TaxID=1344416 RepID=A0A139AHC2_GONPJ|nr:hypothetical protein M427DRAFT_495294 [Gonapodya prolifera JEL478]|eukprot:KXS16221.1 hypothetical protein M427DRAFT_495294 [Gonapodya prolifera JEL478]
MGVKDLISSFQAKAASSNVPPIQPKPNARQARSASPSPTSPSANSASPSSPSAEGHSPSKVAAVAHRFEVFQSPVQGVTRNGSVGKPKHGPGGKDTKSPTHVAPPTVQSNVMDGGRKVEKNSRSITVASNQSRKEASPQSEDAATLIKSSGLSGPKEEEQSPRSAPQPNVTHESTSDSSPPPTAVASDTSPSLSSSEPHGTSGSKILPSTLDTAVVQRGLAAMIARGGIAGGMRVRSKGGLYQVEKEDELSETETAGGSEAAGERHGESGNPDVSLPSSAGVSSALHDPHPPRGPLPKLNPKFERARGPARRGGKAGRSAGRNASDPEVLATDADADKINDMEGGNGDLDQKEVEDPSNPSNVHGRDLHGRETSEGASSGDGHRGGDRIIEDGV